ncbi:DEAD/DEAH box helicase [Gemmatimonas phototrophica]|uniref:DEAD/DEAH box helicase n=1 Tax=Gemmatimonas phototrophica TaxID=1379270 RepID=UPI0006A71654|nr:DEAD/DEAH box helicase [Gemmatimonas phototrophica]
MLDPELERLFSPVLRERARAYLAPGLITWRQVHHSRVDATVQGTQMYRVQIEVDVRDAQSGCTCAYASEHGMCKHQWAVMMLLDREGALPEGLHPAAAPLRVAFVTPEEHQEFAAPPREVVPEEPTGPQAEWQIAMRATALAQRARDLRPESNRATAMPADRRIVYLVHATEVSDHPGVRVQVATQRRTRDGVWEESRHFGFSADAWFNATDPADRLIAEMLHGSQMVQHVTGMPPDGFHVPPRAYGTTLRAICDTGRALLATSRRSLDGRVMKWDDGAPWTVALRVERPDAERYALVGDVQRDGLSRPLADVEWVSPKGLIIQGDTLARFDAQDIWPLVHRLWYDSSLDLGDDPSPFLADYHLLRTAPKLSLPPGELQTEADAAPVPYLSITSGPDAGRRSQAWLMVRFRYGTAMVDAQSPAPTTFDRNTRTLYRRRMAAERNAVTRLRALGALEMYSHVNHRMGLTMSSHLLPRATATLVREGWQVETDGALLVAPGKLEISLSSGIDWFDLHGGVRYGEQMASFAAVLAAAAAGEEQVRLPDGSMGVLPMDQIATLQALMALAERRGDALRFRPAQLAMLDALLDELPDVDVDAHLAHARAQLHEFREIAPEPVPDGFVGELRNYQRDGLSWFAFLRRFQLGGCLADDMGLGKTVQVLAMLEARRAEGKGLSLLVVPRSLVFNWMREAERFAPALRVLDLSHAEREIDALDAADADVVVSTYGTLRRDIDRLGSRRFDYVVLDEAQAIKNASTATAKAARLLQGDHRLALTGTPIENRIEELWSLFEFLNPGMLGASTRFSTAARMLGQRAGDGVTLPGQPRDDLFSRALRPVILRRTKGQVASELPMRTEQTLEVELEPRQRAFYEELRQQYVESVFAQVEREGLSKSRMHILEALLRLRQAACHPSLVDPRKAALPSAKLDVIVPSLQEIANEGHKALVFSQFTSFLSLLRNRLDAQGIPYEYLDGKTRDRQARVERFQSAEGPPLFLISLKAGGHGLNLTAAEYVFLLDPWWNPAVEAQAIDRAHRIGQTRHVLATRVVARDTIESKILELQASKRALADSILSEDRGGLASIGRDELALLLS